MLAKSTAKPMIDSRKSIFLPHLSLASLEPMDSVVSTQLAKDAASEVALLDLVVGEVVDDDEVAEADADAEEDGEANAGAASR